MTKMNRFKDPEAYSEDEYNKINSELHEKYNKKEKLTPEEQFFICSCLHQDQLQQFPFCEEELFNRLFIKYHHTVHDQGPKIPRFVIQSHEISSLRKMVNEWKLIVRNDRHKDQLIQFVAKETRRELKDLKRNFPTVHLHYSTYEHIRREYNIYMFSRYLYGVCRRIIINYPKTGIELNYRNEKIYFDHITLAHVLFRHYGEVMKQYETGASYFDDFFFDYKQLHVVLQHVLTQIDDSGFLKNDNSDKISFKLKGKAYQLFIQDNWIQVPGKGNIKVKKLKTIYPIIEQRIINDLENNYSLVEIANTLSVYVKKTDLTS